MLHIAFIVKHRAFSEILHELDPDYEVCAQKDEWTIFLDSDVVNGSSDSERFDMKEFLLRIGIKPEVVTYHGFQNEKEIA